MTASQSSASIANLSMFRPIAAGVLALGIFCADVITPPDCVVSGLYVVVVLIAGSFCRPRQLWLVAAGCIGLTVLGQPLSDRFGAKGDATIGAFNAAVSLVAIGLSTYLLTREQVARAALLRSQTDLAHVSRVTTMGELTASIAHEVNQPIAAVVTNASACLRWLAGDTPDLEEARAATARIVRDGTRAGEIITRIRLLFTKGEPHSELVDINQLARETADLLRSEAVRYASSIRLDLDASAPQVIADRVQLQQVLVNLVVNGVDAMRNVDGLREIVVTSRRSDGGEVLLSVADTGVGLPTEKMDEMFDPFFTTKAHGTGMGLSISRSIVEAHQGRLWATANRPRGAVFQISLPVHNPAVEADRTLDAA